MSEIRSHKKFAKSAGLNGVVERVVENSLGYLRSQHDGRNFSFTPETIENYRGQSFRELKLKVNTPVIFFLDSKFKKIRLVKIEKVLSAKKIPKKAALQRIRATKLAPPPGPAQQFELLPNKSSVGSIPDSRALPTATRKFGKLIDTSTLRAGDLLLTRELHARDNVSKLILSVQGRGGYGPVHARWVHAAMYLGDEANVIEATFDSPWTGGSVRITSLDEYCQGTTVLRFRRPRALRQERDGWRVCIRALSRLNKPYNFLHAVKMWYSVIVQGKILNQEERPISSAVVCSTLYADSYNEATGQSLGEVSGVCVPAWLSATGDFDDIEVNWLRIA